MGTVAGQAGTPHGDQCVRYGCIIDSVSHIIVAVEAQVGQGGRQEHLVVTAVRLMTPETVFARRLVDGFQAFKVLEDFVVALGAQLRPRLDEQLGEIAGVWIVATRASASRHGTVVELEIFGYFLMTLGAIFTCRSFPKQFWIGRSVWVVANRTPVLFDGCV